MVQVRPSTPYSMAKGRLVEALAGLDHRRMSALLAQGNDGLPGGNGIDLRSVVAETGMDIIAVRSAHRDGF